MKRIQNRFCDTRQLRLPESPFLEILVLVVRPINPFPCLTPQPYIFIDIFASLSKVVREMLELASINRRPVPMRLGIRHGIAVYEHPERHAQLRTVFPVVFRRYQTESSARLKCRLLVEVAFRRLASVTCVLTAVHNLGCRRQSVKYAVAERRQQIPELSRLLLRIAVRLIPELRRKELIDTCWCMPGIRSGL